MTCRSVEVVHECYNDGEVAAVVADSLSSLGVVVGGLRHVPARARYWSIWVGLVA